MHAISTIVTHLAAASPQPGGPNAATNQSGTPFQISAAARPTTATQGVSGTVSPSLGSQTVSALLQTQDLSQTQGHGHGGGGHHGGMKTTPGLEAEEAGESEEAQMMRRRKKLANAAKAGDVSRTAELDENGLPRAGDAEQSETETDQELNSQNPVG